MQIQFYVWLLSFNIMTLTFIHLIVCISSLCLFSLLLFSRALLYGYTIVDMDMSHSLTFQLLELFTGFGCCKQCCTKLSCINLCVGCIFSIPLEILECGLALSYGRCVFNFVRKYQFSKVSVVFYIATSSVCQPWIFQSLNSDFQ